MNKVEKYISDKSKELELNLTRFIQRVFPESQEIVPTLFLIDNTGQMNLVNVNQIFALSKDERYIHLAFIINQFKPIICCMINEAWSVFVNRDESLDVMPSESPKREEIVLLHIISPFQTQMITFNVTPDFQNITGEGQPFKTLSEPNGEMKNMSSFLVEIYEKTGPSKTEVEQVVIKNKLKV